MPSALPVPSKGALRALRTLALGTSCTIALTVGVLTEDRRRRIHTASKACENGRKLRSAPNYRPGEFSLEALEERILTGNFGEMFEAQSKDDQSTLAEVSSFDHRTRSTSKRGERGSYPPSEKKARKTARQETSFPGMIRYLPYIEPTPYSDRRKNPLHSSKSAFKRIQLQDIPPKLEEVPAPEDVSLPTSTRRKWRRFSSGMARRIFLSQSKDSQTIRYFYRRAFRKVDVTMSARSRRKYLRNILKRAMSVKKTRSSPTSVTSQAHKFTEPGGNLDYQASEAIEVSPPALTEISSSDGILWKPVPCVESHETFTARTPLQTQQLSTPEQKLDCQDAGKIQDAFSAVDTKATTPSTNLWKKRLPEKTHQRSLSSVALQYQPLWESEQKLEDFVTMQDPLPPAVAKATSFSTYRALKSLGMDERSHEMEFYKPIISSTAGSPQIQASQGPGETQLGHLSSNKARSDTSSHSPVVELSPAPTSTTQKQSFQPLGETNLNDSLVQENLARTIVDSLSSGDPAQLETSATQLLRNAKETHASQSRCLTPALLDAAILLNKACIQAGRLEPAGKVLEAVIGFGPIDEDLYQSFDPEQILTHIVQQLGTRDEDHYLSLERACTLFSPGLQEKPRNATAAMISLGDRLCAATCRFKAFRLTGQVYWRIEASRGDSPNKNIDSLIYASFQLGEYKDLIRFFRRFYKSSSPNQILFYRTVGVIIDSICKLQQNRIRVDILEVVFAVAHRVGIKVSTTHLLRYLGHVWHTHQDLSQTRALFDFLEPRIQLVGHPQAVYGAIIQFCIEAREESAARDYYARFRQKYAPSERDMRIYGHFAYAKALRGDWDGVRESFKEMMEFYTNDKAFLARYSAAFSPIFVLFGKSHSMNETEDFLREFSENFGVQLTTNMGNSMMAKYLQARDIGAASRWLDYMNSVGLRTWDFKPEEIDKLHRSVRSLGSKGRPLIDDPLKSSAMSLSGSRPLIHMKQLQGLWNLDLKDSKAATNLKEEMASLLAKGKPADSLELYHTALNKNFALPEAVTSLAIQTTLRAYPEDTAAVKNLLQELQRKGQELGSALSTVLVHQISGIGKYSDKNEIMRVCQNTISAFEDQGIPINIRVYTHTMSKLVHRGRYRDAIEFWSWSQRHLDESRMTIDLATLTVLLQAYIGLQDCQGIRWIVRILDTQALVPDRHFKLMLLNCRGEVEKCIATNEAGLASKVAFHREIVAAIEKVREVKYSALQEQAAMKAQVCEVVGKAFGAKRSSRIAPLKLDSLHMTVEEKSHKFLDMPKASVAKALSG